MATEERPEMVSRDAGVDLSADSYVFTCVKLNAGKVVPTAAITDATYGVLQEGAPLNSACAVGVGGVVRAKAGGVITPGAQVATKADGTLQIAVATQYVIGTYVGAANTVANEIISVHLVAPQIKA